MRASVLVMAGGTGGHVFPALTVAEELRARGFVIHWLGTEQGIETRLVPPRDFPLHLLRVVALRGGGWYRKLIAPWRLLLSVLAARRVVRQTLPKLAIGFGGFASGPGGIAARLAGVPLVIHEQNAVPGMTNRMLARGARCVLQAFEGAFGENAVTVGNPVRKEIAVLEPPAVRYATRQGPLRILVTGGSQGALVLNTRLPAELVRIFGERQPVIRHQAGRDRCSEAEQAYVAAGLAAQVDEFIDDMAAAYGWADLVICRAGALTVSEVAAAGVAALFVPLPTAVDDHQTFNARWLADESAGLLLPQARLEAGALAEVLARHMTREALAELAVRARSQAITDSARRTADICEEILRD